ncbi:MAG: XRE family transcriptional regulator [Porticoccaceae bacterium]
MCFTHFEKKVRKTQQADVDLGFAPEDAAVPAMRARLVTDPRQHIGSKNLTQQETAAKLGIAPSRVYDLVRGKREKFSPEVLIALEGRLGRKVRLALAA